MVNDEVQLNESLSKKHTRVMAWVEAFKSIASKARVEGPHLVFVNPAGEGNIAVLYGLGLQPKTILAVGPSEEDVFAAHEKYVGLDPICSEVLPIVKEYRRRLVSATFNFDEYLRDEYVDLMVPVIHQGLRDDAVLMFTSPVDLETAEVSFKNLSPNVIRPDQIGDVALLSACDTLVSQTVTKTMGRFDVQAEYVSFFYFKLAKALGPHRILLRPLSAQRYVEGGKIFLTCLFSTRRLNKNVPEVKFWTKSAAYLKDYVFFHGDYTGIKEKDFVSEIARLEDDEPPPRGLRLPMMYNVEPSVMEALKKKYERSEQ